MDIRKFILFLLAGAVLLAVSLLVTLVVVAAEPAQEAMTAKDITNRLEVVIAQRQAEKIRMQVGQLIAENAFLREKQLGEEEQYLRAQLKIGQGSETKAKDAAEGKKGP